jgi:uncharacterized protein (DUF983 family)
MLTREAREVLYRAIAQCAFALASIPLMNANDPATATLATIVVLFTIDIVLMVRGRQPLSPRAHLIVPLIVTVIIISLAAIFPTALWLIATTSGVIITASMVATALVINRAL